MILLAKCFSMANTITACWSTASWYKKDPQAMTWSKVAICLHTGEKKFLKNKGTSCSNSSDAINSCYMLTREYRIECYIHTQICRCTHTEIWFSGLRKEQSKKIYCDQDIWKWLWFWELASVNFKTEIFIHKTGAHNSQELWTSGDISVWTKH